MKYCGRERSPIRREFSRYRDTQTPFVDTYVKPYRSRLSPAIPYRSRSYQSDLNRLTPISISTTSNQSTIDLSRADRLRSYSALNLDRKHYPSTSSVSSINAYSRHYSHHNYVSRPPSTQPWRNVTSSIDSTIRSRASNYNRFRSRSTYKSYRSRSANPPDKRDNLSSVRSISSVARIPTLSDINSMRFSRSLSDLRATYSRINYSSDLTNSLLHERSSSSCNIPENNILNPDIYVRWLKNKRDMDFSTSSSLDFTTKYLPRFDSNRYVNKTHFNDSTPTIRKSQTRAYSCSKLSTKTPSYSYQHFGRFTPSLEKYHATPKFMEPMKGNVLSK